MFQWVIVLIVIANIFSLTSGLEFYPKPPANVSSNLIWYQSSNETSTNYWTHQLDDFFKVYQESRASVNIQRCNGNTPPAPGKVCAVDVNSFGPCRTQNHYGYLKSSPCVFIKMDKILNWQPEFYNSSLDLPELMPIDLKYYIHHKVEHNQQLVNTVWVSCEGESPADVENIGPIVYIPSRGFPGYYFPYRNIEGYMSPLVAVMFERPQIGVIINVECKAWAHNIKHDGHVGLGLVRFQLLID